MWSPPRGNFLNLDASGVQKGQELVALKFSLRFSIKSFLNLHNVHCAIEHCSPVVISLLLREKEENGSVNHLVLRPFHQVGRPLQ